MSGRLFVDLLVERLMSTGVPTPKGVRMATHSGDGDQSELQSLIDLHTRVWPTFPYATASVQSRLADDIAHAALKRTGHGSNPRLHKDLAQIVRKLIALEPAFHAFSLGTHIDALSPLMVSKFIEDISHRLRVITDKETQEAEKAALETIIVGLLRGVPNHITPNETASATTLSARLLDIIDKPLDTMTTVLAQVLGNDDVQGRGLYGPLSRQLYRNLLTASGIAVDPDRPLLAHELKKPILPQECLREPSSDVAARYFANTPLLDLWRLSVPVQIPQAVRFEHTHIIGGTGHGKTQALQHLIAADLSRPRHDVPSMVIIDSQGDMINKLKKLALFDPKIENALADRLLIVDPSDVAYAPALNLFDIQSDRARHYDQKEREQVLAGIIEIYDYIFSGLLGAELSQKQSVIFRFLAQLMLAIPGATIHTLRETLEDANPNMDVVERLPPTARDFFKKQFFGSSYKATREQVLRRLYGVLQNQSFERMFANKVNRLDLFEVLNNGGIVLVNTSKDFLKSDASSMFGRYVIALTLKAAFERAALPFEQRRPTFLWIDEASEYFDDNIDNLLIQARKFNLGVVMAHQYLKQLKGNLPASLMTNTSIKLVGGVSVADARVLAPELHTTPEFLSAMSKRDAHAEFGAFIRNRTPHAIQVAIPFGTVEAMPQMSDESFDILLNASRHRLSSAYASTNQDNENDQNHTDPQSAADNNSSNRSDELGGSHFEPYD